MATRTKTPESTETWTETLAASRDHVLAAARAGRHGAAVLAHAAAGRIVAAWTLDPAPIRAKWEEHLSGLGDWHYHLWAVLMLQTWLAERNA